MKYNKLKSYNIAKDAIKKSTTINEEVNKRKIEFNIDNISIENNMNKIEIAQINIDILQNNYKFLRIIENGLRLIHDDSTNLILFEHHRSETIKKLLKYQGYEVHNLIDSLEKITSEVRNIYLKYFIN